MLSILIPGLILVALMAYASTRIKKNAAAAFDPETIETDEFIIQKPEGFLHNINGDPKYMFEAYSKELSKRNDEKVRIGTATITKIANSTLGRVVEDLIQDATLIDDDGLMIDEKQYRCLKLTRNSDDIETEVSYKLAGKNGSVYQLAITATQESASGPWVQVFFDTFRVK